MAKHYYCLKRINSIIGFARSIYRLINSWSFIRLNWKKTCNNNFWFFIYGRITFNGLCTRNICPYDWQNYCWAWSRNCIDGCASISLRSFSNLIKRWYCSLLHISCYSWLIICQHNCSCMWQKLETNARTSSNSSIHLISLDVFYARISKMAS